MFQKHIILNKSKEIVFKGVLNLVIDFLRLFSKIKNNTNFNTKYNNSYWKYLLKVSAMFLLMNQNSGIEMKVKIYLIYYKNVIYSKIN